MLYDVVDFGCGLLWFVMMLIFVVYLSGLLIDVFYVDYLNVVLMIDVML